MKIDDLSGSFKMQIAALRTDGIYFYVNMAFPYDLFATGEHGNIERRAAFATELAKALSKLDEFRTCGCRSIEQCKEHRK